MSPKIVWLLQRLGPYHDARLRAWKATGAHVAALEFRVNDIVYAWDDVRDTGQERHRVSSSLELRNALSKLNPSVLVCTGYADAEIHTAIVWALKNKVRLVTCSDSTWADEPRSRVKETVKRLLLEAFDAGLVAGVRSRDYLLGLGFCSKRLFQPWDVVDNAYFAKGRASEIAEPYFLCVARFVPKKNLSRLITAFATYVGRSKKPWRLVLSGSGPLELELKSQVEAAGLMAMVEFPGFLQYPDLPDCYAAAGALVLPSVSDQWGLVVNEAMAAGLPVLVSERCGCAADLVRDGENGFIFDPLNVDQLAGLLSKVTDMSDAERSNMGRRSQEIISAYSPEAFAAGVQAAVACAETRRGRRVPVLTRWLVRLLAMRSK